MSTRTQFTWTIPNYDTISQNLSSLHSPTFNMNILPNKSWFLLLQRDLYNTDIIRFYAYCNGVYDEYFYTFTMTLKIKNSSRRKLLIVTKKNKTKFKANKWHWIGMFENSDLLQFLVNNDLVLFFELDVISIRELGNGKRKIMQTEVIQVEDTETEDIKTENMESEENKVFSFMNDKTFSDVTLHVGQRKIFAHKVILATESKVFHEMFTADESLDKVKITNVSYEVLMEMLRHLYTGQVENLEKLGIEIMKAAHSYQIKDLIGICENSMIEYLNDNNVVDFLMLADDCQAHILKNESLKRIQRNLDNFRSSTKLEPLSKEHAHLLLDIIKGIPIQTNNV